MPAAWWVGNLLARLAGGSAYPAGWSPAAHWATHRARALEKVWKEEGCYHYYVIGLGSLAWADGFPTSLPDESPTGCRD